MMKSIKYTLTILCALVSFQLQAADGVARAGFTTAIDDHEPTNEVTKLTNDTTKIYYFTEIRGLQGQTITHRWSQNNEVQASVSFPVGGNRWRIWSSKNLPTEATGKWQVMVLDESGGILSQSSFDYVAAATQSDDAATEMAVEADTNPANSNQPDAMESIPESELYKIAPAAGGTSNKTTD